MEKSPTLAKLAAALSAFQADMESVTKDATNPFYKSKYATLENIISTAKPHLKAHGLSFSQLPDADGLTTIVMHVSGEFIQATCRMTPKDDSPQAQGSAISYGRRYALSAALGIATDEDDDGNAASKAPVAPQEARRTTQAAKPTKETALRVEAAKERIVTLLAKLGKPTKTKKQCEDAVFDICGMLLTPENYDDIGEALAKALAIQE